MARKLEDLLAQEKPEVVAAAKAKAGDMLLDIRLAEIRQLAEKPRQTSPVPWGLHNPRLQALRK